MEDRYNVKRTIVMICESTIYENVIYDKEITECNGVSFDSPMKFVYDPTVRIYYIIIKASPKIEEKMGNNIVIVNDSQFGDKSVKEEDLFASIARVTNFIEYNKKIEEVTENTEE